VISVVAWLARTLGRGEHRPHPAARGATLFAPNQRQGARASVGTRDDGLVPHYCLRTRMKVARSIGVGVQIRLGFLLIGRKHGRNDARVWWGGIPIASRFLCMHISLLRDFHRENSGTLQLQNIEIEYCCCTRS
jgi:hypothetical protein